MTRTIRINGIDVPVIDDQLTGAELKRMGNVPDDRVLVRQHNDHNTIVPDERRIRVANHDSFTHHARHSKAAPTPPLDLRSHRIRREAAQLAAAYPNLQVGAGEAFVFIPGFRLPREWSPRHTSLLIVPPAHYPEAAPNGFYVGADLLRRSGPRLTRPGHYFATYNNPYAHAGYHWYCLEDPDRRWNPALDSLVTFIEAIRTYLGTAD